MTLSEAQQIKMYGETEEQMVSAARRSGSYDSDMTMYAMSILSDAQEVLARGQSETARQYINKAKYFISEVHARLREDGR